MKKLTFAAALVTVMVTVLTGCLKDKGFDNHQYGINDPDTQPPGAGFAFGNRDKVDFGLDVSSSNQPVTNIVYAQLFAGSPAAADVQITLSNNTTALVAAYNAANGTSIQALPTGVWNVPMTLTIPAGSYNVNVPLNVTNTTGLDPNVQYAVGLTITDVTGGYKIADNYKNLLIVFGVKNQYDGRYNLRGMFYHPSYPFYPFVTNVEMHTSGPNSVKMYYPPFDDYLNPFATSPTGGGITGFDLQDPEFTVNPTTSAVTVANVATGGTIVYAMGLGFNNAGYNSRWDPGSKTFYVCYGYNLGGGGAFVLGTSREWIDTAARTGPR